MNAPIATAPKGWGAVLRGLSRLKERLDAKYVKAGPDECWLWTAACTGGGYATFKVAGKQSQASRVSLGLAVGFVPQELNALHSCDVRNCVNPAHLRWGTPKENTADMRNRGRCYFSSRTHCPQGHEYIEQNIIRTANGGRNCRACNVTRKRESYRRNKSKFQQETTNAR